MVWQPFKEKESSKFKPVKVNFLSGIHVAASLCRGVGKYTHTHTHTHTHTYIYIYIYIYIYHGFHDSVSFSLFVAWVQRDQRLLGREKMNRKLLFHLICEKAIGNFHENLKYFNKYFGERWEIILKAIVFVVYCPYSTIIWCIGYMGFIWTIGQLPSPHLTLFRSSLHHFSSHSFCSFLHVAIFVLIHWWSMNQRYKKSPVPWRMKRLTLAYVVCCLFLPALMASKTEWWEQYNNMGLTLKMELFFTPLQPTNDYH